MKKKTLFLLLLFSIISYANKNRIFFVGNVLNFDDIDNDFNIIDYYSINAGIFADSNYLVKTISLGYNYNDNSIHRFYNPYKDNMFNIYYFQKTKINDNVFFSGLFQVDNYRRTLNHSLEINPYRIPFIFTDTTSGTLSGNRIYITPSLNYRIHNNFIISSEVTYSVSNFLKDKYVKAETFNILFSYSLCFAYLTSKDEIFMKIGSGLEKNKLIAIKEQFNPEVFIRLGENVFKKRTSSSFKGYKRDDFNIITLGFIHRFNEAKAIGSRLSYSYNKYKIWDGKLSKNYWGMVSNDSIFYDLTFKYNYHLMGRFYYAYSNTWSRSYYYDFLYQEEKYNKLGFNLSVMIDRNILTNYYNQLSFEYINDKYSDYVGSFYYKKRGFNFHNSFIISHKITEYLNMDLSFDMGYIKQGKFFNFNSVKYSGISSVITWDVYMVGFKYNIYFSNKSTCNNFKLYFSFNFN